MPPKLDAMSGKRRLEMVEGSSSKFWEVSVEGSSFTVTYGRIGAPGTSKTTACASPEAARAEADKLIREKTKKGYSEPGSSVVSWRPPTHIPTDQHPERFLNYKVTGFDPDADGQGDGERRDLPALRELDKRAFRIGITYDDDPEAFDARLEALLADPKVDQLRALLVGNWFADVCEEGPVAVLEQLRRRGNALASLKGLFVGDIIQEECEISWIHQGDYGLMLRALPQLEELVVRGGDGLRFEGLEHPQLRSLTVQTGGLSSNAVRDIASAKLPSLRTLTLWLGVADYGGDSSVDDLAPFLAGDRFPQLEHLGLQNSEHADEIAHAVARSPVLGRLRGLDLSMGTLTDDGARALIAAPGVRTLKHLNVRHHFLSADTVKQLKALGIEVNASDRQEADEHGGQTYRYPEVTE